MHEQDFEKQVQQKMEELSLTPSAPVWQKVEEQIRKKKDRRRLIFWLLPLLLVGGGAGWMLWGPGDNRVPAPTVHVTGQPAAPSHTVPQNAPAPSAPADGTEATTINTPGPQALKENIPTPVNNKPTLTAKRPERLTKKDPKLTALSITPGREVAPAKESAPTGDLALEKKEKEVVNDVSVIREEAETTRERAITGNEEERLPETAADSVAIAVQLEAETKTTELTIPAAPVAPTVATDSAQASQATPVQKINTSKWQWTVHAEAGITSVWSTLFQLPATRTYAAFNSPAQLSGGNFFAYYPSPQDEGPSFSAGLTAKRILSKRTKLTAGVQYNYYTTRLAVGEQKNVTATAAMVPYARQSTVAPNAYLPGTQNDYTNRYHFIQLPVGIEYQVFRGLPLQVHGGVALAHLVTTNALSYDYSVQGYYQNSKDFNATQLHLFTNLTYPLWKGRSKKLDVGPYVQYSLTELQKTATDKNRLFSTGLRTQVSF